MNRFDVIGRLAVVLAGLAGTLLAFTAGAVPAAMASVSARLGGDPHGRPGLPGPPGANKRPPLPGPAHAVVTGGMPGWQITAIVAGAALVAAALAIIVYRAWTARRRVTVSAA